MASLALLHIFTVSPSNSLVLTSKGSRVYATGSLELVNEFVCGYDFFFAMHPVRLGKGVSSLLANAMFSLLCVKVLALSQLPRLFVFLSCNDHNNTTASVVKIALEMVTTVS